MIFITFMVGITFMAFITSMGDISTNRLLINQGKTKCMVFGTLQLIGKLRDTTFPFLGRYLSPSPFRKD